jgi:hypothetical protein
MYSGSLHESANRAALSVCCRSCVPAEVAAAADPPSHVSAMKPSSRDKKLVGPDDGVDHEDAARLVDRNPVGRRGRPPGPSSQSKRLGRA